MSQGGFDMQQLLQQAQQMQQQLADAQAELTEAELTGTAGGGLVTATVSGTGELKALDIDPSVVDPDDIETLADLIVAAVRAAADQAQQLSRDTMGPITGGDLPGLT